MQANDTISNSELAILGLLAEQPKHGYQIEQDIQDRGMREWTEIAFSSIYHLLNKLEATGWLESTKQSAGDRPARKVYRLSPNGWYVYTQAVATRLREPRPNSGDFPLALANLGCLDRTQMIAALQSNRKALQSRLEHVREKHAADLGASPELPWFVNALFDYSENQIAADLGFINQLLEQITATFSPGE